MNLLEIQHLNKFFGANQALNQINLAINAGQVHSLVGENGAGKSTIIKIITGVYQPTSGHVVWENKITKIQNPRDAQHLGINVIHQDRQLIPYFTGLENLFLNKAYPQRKRGFGIDWAKMKREASKLQEEWGISIPLSIPVSEMSPSEKTLLEILRAIMMESKLLILDEPTASLTDKESELLFSFIKRLKQKGVAILYVSHRLEEVISLSDKVTVLFGGRVAATLDKSNLSKEILIKQMTGGQELKKLPSSPQQKIFNKTLLSIKGLKTKDGLVKEVNLQLLAGQILGIYGLAGSGRTELLEAIYGLRKIEEGMIKVDNQPITIPTTPVQSLKKGVVLIPENRHEHSLIMEHSIKENMTLPILTTFTKKGIIQKKQEAETVGVEMDRFQIKATGSQQPISELSGGNQQKVVFAKAALSKPNIFLCDEPTQAVDIMTRTEIHHFLKKQAEQGKGVIFVSSDLAEVLEICDRIMVLSNGKSVAEFENTNLQPDQILEICYRHQEVVS